MTENILFADFTERGRDEAVRALASLDLAHDERALKLHEARVISRDDEGDVEVPAEVDHTRTAAGFAVGGLVGALVGLVGGPVGVMIGFGAGGLIGGAQDARQVTETNATLEELTAEIPPGSTILVAQVDEETPEAADDALGGGVRRYEAAAVRKDLEAALKAPDEPAEDEADPSAAENSGSGSGGAHTDRG